jgi:hypothetical protein
MRKKHIIWSNFSNARKGVMKEEEASKKNFREAENERKRERAAEKEEEASKKHFREAERERKRERDLNFFELYPLCYRL